MAVRQAGYRKISYSDADYFNPSANDSRIATATREKPAPSVEQIRHVVASIAVDSDIDRRDRALIAFALLSGARDDAIASLALRHIDLSKRTVFQDARSVRTKNRKTFTSWFFPVGEDIEAIVADWMGFLTSAFFQNLWSSPAGPNRPSPSSATRVAGKTGSSGPKSLSVVRNPIQSATIASMSSPTGKNHDVKVFRFLVRTLRAS